MRERDKAVGGCAHPVLDHVTTLSRVSFSRTCVMGTRGVRAL